MNGELYHYGVKGMKWGVITNKVKPAKNDRFFIPSPGLISTGVKVAKYGAAKVKQAVRINKAKKELAKVVTEKPPETKPKEDAAMSPYLNNILNNPVSVAHSSGAMTAGEQAVKDYVNMDAKIKDALHSVHHPSGGGTVVSFGPFVDESTSIVNWANNHNMSVAEAMADYGYSPSTIASASDIVENTGSQSIAASQELNELIKKKKSKVTAKKTVVGKKKTTSAKPIKIVPKGNYGGYYE